MKNMNVAQIVCVYVCMIGVKEFPSHRAQKTRYKHVFILYAYACVCVRACIKGKLYLIKFKTRDFSTFVG